MRVIHTSDWHLGRIFHRVHLTDDQSYVLDQFVDLVRDERPDAVIIAGDIYDRSVPPVEAVQLLDETLSRLTLGLKVPTLMIAGNHDSPHRLNFGTRLLARQGLHVVGLPSAEASFASCTVELRDSDGPVRFVLMPYAEPAVIRDRLGVADAVDHESAMRALVCAAMGGSEEGAEPCSTGGVRTVAIAHAFIAGGSVSESERPLSVGGTGAVSLSHFSRFNYTALGHLHRPQTLGGGRARYAGSLMKYSFDEADQRKSVTIVDLSSEGLPIVREVALTPRRDVRRVRGMFDDILRGPTGGESREDYISVTLLDTGQVHEPMARLREVYPSILEIGREEFGVQQGVSGIGLRHKEMTELELFAAFFEETTGTPLTEEQERAFITVLEAAEARREVALA
ncbi:MAG: exonuclease SbcCD subunit D [Clostridia bacterium]|nr:exonuclease SbcCD subunit D [Clostridia bacterium]